MWILYSVLGAFSDTVRDVLQKRNTEEYNPIISGFALNFYGALICIPFLIIFGVPNLKEGYWTATLTLSFFSSLWPILFSYALSHDKLLNLVPLLSLNPIMTTIGVLLFSHKAPSVLGWMGILLVFLGLYLSRFDTGLFKKRGIFFPFIHLFSSVSSICMVGVGLCWSIGAIAANIIIHTSSPLFYIPTSVISSCIFSFLIVLIFERSFFRKIISLSFHMLPFSVIHLVSEFSVGMALSTGFLPYVASIKRSAIIGSTIAGVVIFKEKITIFKIVGVLITFIGVVTIILTR